VDLDDVHLHERDQVGGFFDIQILSHAVLPVGDGGARHDPRALPPVVVVAREGEGPDVAGGAPEGERPPDDVRQHRLRHLLVVARHVALGDPLAGKDHALGVGRIAPLRDDPLGAEPARLGQHRPPRPVDVIGVAQRAPHVAASGRGRRSFPSSINRSNAKQVRPTAPSVDENDCWSAWKLVRPSGPSTTTSPSSSASRAANRSAARAISGKRSVQSLPRRLVSRTRTRARRPRPARSTAHPMR
jgi:hypothetical protein